MKKMYYKTSKNYEEAIKNARKTTAELGGVLVSMKLAPQTFQKDVGIGQKVYIIISRNKIISKYRR